MFPATQPLSALGQKTGSTTVVSVIHTAINGLTGVGALYLISAGSYPETAAGGDRRSTARMPKSAGPINLPDVRGHF